MLRDGVDRARPSGTRRRRAGRSAPSSRPCRRSRSAFASSARRQPRLGDDVVARRRLRGPVRARRRERHDGDHRPRRVHPDRRTTAPRWRSWSPTHGRGTGSRRSCSPISPSIAEQHGIATFTAEVLPHNHRMIDVFRESGFPVDLRSTPDAIEIEFPTSLSPDAIERVRGARADRRRRRRPQLPGAALGRGDRRLAPARDDRRRDPPQPPRVRVQRVGLRRSTRRPTSSSRSRPTDVGQRHPRLGRAGGRRRAGRAGRRRRPRVRGGRRPSAARHLRGLRRGRRRGGRAPAASCSRCAASAGMRLIGPNCLGVLNTDAERAAQRHLRAAIPRSPGTVGFLVAERRTRDRDHRGGGPARGSGSRRSSRSATRPTCRATTSSSTGSRTRTPRSRCSTWSRSGTRGSSPASPAGSRATSRSSRSRAAARRPARAPPRRTPGRCCPPPTSPSTPCSSRPG